jgi:hypothetical protein
MVSSGESLVNIQKTNWKDPPFYSWENPLFRLGHFQWQTISLPEGIWFYMYFLCLLHHRLIFDADRLSHIWCTESSFSGYMMDVLDSVSNGYLLDMVTSPPMAKNYPQILEAPGRLLSST